jgi:glycosidase
MGRIGWFVRAAHPKASDDEITRRVILAHAFLMFTRGAPVIYYGDEQGLAGEGGDKDARQDMFASQVAAYSADRLVDGARRRAIISRPTGRSTGDLGHGAVARRRAGPAARRQVVRAAGDKPGLFAVSRMTEAGEVLVAFNTGLTPIAAQVEVDATSRTGAPPTDPAPPPPRRRAAIGSRSARSTT